MTIESDVINMQFIYVTYLSPVAPTEQKIHW